MVSIPGNMGKTDGNMGWEASVVMGQSNRGTVTAGRPIAAGEPDVARGSRARARGAVGTVGEADRAGQEANWGASACGGVRGFQSCCGGGSLGDGVCLRGPLGRITGRLDWGEPAAASMD